MNVSVNNHVPVGDHRCEVCGNKPYEHAWWYGWDAMLEEPANEEERADAEEVIAEREPLVEHQQ